MRRCQTHIHKIDIHTKYEIEHRCLRSRRCDVRKLPLREPPRNLRGQNKAYSRDTTQHIAQEEHQALCRLRHTRTHNAKRRCPRIEKGSAVHMLMDRAKWGIAP